MSNEPMTDIEMARGIRRFILNKAAEVMSYTNWSPEFAAAWIRDIPETVRNMSEFAFINVANLWGDELEELGFGNWSTEDPLWLIPLWIVPFLDPNMEVVAINGEKCKLSDADNDTRGGRLAYGFYGSTEPNPDDV